MSRREESARRTGYRIGISRAQRDRDDGIVEKVDQLWRPRGCSDVFFSELQRGYADEMFGTPPNRLQESAR